jgi:hypothetical protein
MQIMNYDEDVRLFAAGPFGAKPEGEHMKLTK